MKVFCLPFAGGNKYSYRVLEQHTPTPLQLVTLEYPGRGTKINEPLMYDMEKLVDYMYHQLIDLLDNESYAIYGHSMGGHLACLLTRLLIKKNKPAPVHVFVSGTPGPAASLANERKRHLLSKEELIEELRILKGSKNEVLEDEDWLAYFEPILRADFQVSETFNYQPTGPLLIPFTVVTGTDEDMEPADIKIWQNETAFPVDFKQMPGAHFFIYDQPKALMDLLSGKLLNNKVY